MYLKKVFLSTVTLIKSCLSCNDFCPSRTFCKTACCCCNKLTMSGFESWHISDAKQPNCLYVGQPRSCSGTAGTLTSPKSKISLLHFHYQHNNPRLQELHQVYIHLCQSYSPCLRGCDSAGCHTTGEVTIHCL